MRKTGLALVSLASLVGIAWAQQQNAATDQSVQQSPAISRSANSTAEDQAVPLCPVNSGDQRKTTGSSGEVKQGVTAPKVIHTANAQFTDLARRTIRKNKHIRTFDDTVLIGLIVDEQGDPQNLCLQKSLGYGLDANAAKAIQQYKFAPATKDDKPVPVKITVEVRYRLY
jgi:TonB family protein